MAKITNDPVRYVKRSDLASKHTPKFASAAMLTRGQKAEISRSFGKSGYKKAGFVAFGAIIRR